jgi:hypothetical protein
MDDVSCLFCSNPKSVCHLFFECCVSKVMWQNLYEICGKQVGNDFESVASPWLCAKKFKTLNICTTAVMWALWKVRNSVFSGEPMAWDAGHFLQVCKADKKVVHNSIRRGGKSTGKIGEGMRKKRCIAAAAPLVQQGSPLGGFQTLMIRIVCWRVFFLLVRML